MADPFLCPICSERQNFPDTPEVTCAGCGTRYGADRIDPLLRSLARLWSPDEKDGDVYVRRVTDALKAEGRTVFLIEKQKYDLKGGQSVRLFLAEGERIKSCLVAVATGEWSQDLMLMMVNVLMTLSQTTEKKGAPPRFAFLASFPLPDPIRYLFANTLHSRFERLAMGTTELWDSHVPVDPASVEPMTNLAVKLIDLCFQIPLNGTMADVKPLEDLVLSRMRFPLEPEDRLAADGYIPAISLLMIGLLVGRAVRKAAHSPCTWTAAPGSHFGLALSTRFRSTGNPGQINLIDKMFKLFKNGASDSVELLARHAVDESQP